MNREFAEELKELLKKYDAQIVFYCSIESDLHGVYCPKLIVESRESEKALLAIDGYCMTAYDISLELK